MKSKLKHSLAPGMWHAIFYDVCLLWFWSLQKHVTIKRSCIHLFYIFTSLLPLCLFQKTLGKLQQSHFTMHSRFVMPQRVVRKSGWGVNTVFTLLAFSMLNCCRCELYIGIYNALTYRYR